MTAVPVARLADLRREVGHQIRVFGRDYSVWLLGADEQVVRIIDNTCLHVGGPLADGAVRDGCVICPWHGWTYDLTTGARQTALGEVPGLGTYPAWVEGDLVWADLPGAGEG